MPAIFSLLARGEDLRQLPVGFTAKAGRLDCSAAKATFTARSAAGRVERTVLEKAFKRSTKLRRIPYRRALRPLAAVLQGRQLHFADHFFQTEFLRPGPPWLPEPGLGRLVAQPAEDHQRGDLRPNGRLGLLGGRLGRQDLFAGFQLRGRQLRVKFGDSPAGDSTTAGLVQAVDVFLQLLDRAVGHHEGILAAALPPWAAARGGWLSPAADDHAKQRRERPGILPASDATGSLVGGSIAVEERANQ